MNMNTLNLKRYNSEELLFNNNELTIRDYIPPMYYERYMAISRKATETRANDRLIKTQLRWGFRDIEIFTKSRGSEEQYKRTNLKDFMGDTELPTFDTKIEWKAKKKNTLRRLPTGWKGRNGKQNLRRQLSVSSDASSKGTERKKIKQCETNEDDVEDENVKKGWMMKIWRMMRMKSCNSENGFSHLQDLFLTTKMYFTINTENYFEVFHTVGIIVIVNLLKNYFWPATIQPTGSTVISFFHEK